MRTVIRQTAGRDFAAVESVLARLFDVMLIALGAAVASLLFTPGAGYRTLESNLVMVDVALALLLLPWFGVYDSWRGRSKWRLAINVVFGWLGARTCTFSPFPLTPASPTKNSPQSPPEPPHKSD